MRTMVEFQKGTTTNLYYSGCWNKLWSIPDQQTKRLGLTLASVTATRSECHYGICASFLDLIAAQVATGTAQSLAFLGRNFMACLTPKSSIISSDPP